MGVRGLLSVVLAGAREEDAAAKKAGQASLWQPLNGKALLVDGHNFTFWVVDMAFTDDYTQWAGGFQRFHEVARRELKRFIDAGVSLTFVFDNRLGLEEDEEEAMKEGTDLDRLLQRRDGLVAAQEALLGHASFGTARRRASVDPPAGDAAAANAGPRFQHRLAHPPTPSLLAAQLKALVERELGLPVLRVVGEADPVLAWGVAAPGSPFAAVLSRDSDFLVYAGGRLLPFDLLDTRAMTGRVLSGEDAARFLGLPSPTLLPPVAMLAGNDATSHHPLRPLLLRSLSLFDGAHIRDVAALFARQHRQQQQHRLKNLLRAFLSAPEHASLARVWEATEAAYTFTAQRSALLQGGVHIPHAQLLAAAAAQAEAAARAALLEGRGLPEQVVDAIFQGRLSRRLGLMLSPRPPPAPQAVAPAAPQAAAAAQDKSALLKQMLFGAGGGGLGLGQPQQQAKAAKEGEDRAVARVLAGMAQEEAAAAARRRRWKAPLLFERLRGSYELLAAGEGEEEGEGAARPGAAALTRRLRALIYGLAGVEGGPVREETLLADDTDVVEVAPLPVLHWAPTLDKGGWEATLSALLQAPSTAQEEDAREALLWTLLHRALALEGRGDTGPGAAMATLRGMVSAPEPETEVGALALVALTLRCMLMASGREIGRPGARLTEGELRALVAMVAGAATRKEAEQEQKGAPVPPPPPPSAAATTTGGSGGVLQEARRSLLGALGLSFGGAKSSNAPAPAPLPVSAPLAEEEDEDDDDDDEEEEEDEEEGNLDVEEEDDAERPFPRKKPRGQGRRRGAQPASLCCGSQVLAVASLAAWALQTHATLREVSGLLGVKVGKRLEPRRWFDGGLLAAALACPDHPERVGEQQQQQAEAEDEAEAARLRGLLWEAVTAGVDLGACLAPAPAGDGDGEEQEQEEKAPPTSTPPAQQQQMGVEDEDLTARLKRQLGLGLGLGFGGAAAARAAAPPLPPQGPTAAAAANDEDEDEDEGDDVVLLPTPSSGATPAKPSPSASASLGLPTPPPLPHRRRSLPLHAALDQAEARAATAAVLSGPLLDEADTDLALEEEREAAARVREAAEEAAGGDTGYVLPTVPASTRAKGPPLGVVSVAALEAQQQLQPRKPTKVEAAKEEVALPILGRRSEIAATIASHRVTIIEGETGCGKSTQVPQFIIGIDPTARVAITTPTRKAATNLAKEVARQLGEEVGQTVGYRIGNERSGDADSGSKRSRILYVTAGWLLQKLVHLPPEAQAAGFTHILLDEVHERSTESDLLCFLLRENLAATPLAPKVVLMSATLQSSIFQEYFRPVVAPASSFTSTRTAAGATTATDAEAEADAERGPAGFYRGEERRERERHEDDVEEEDALVPTLHVGARSPFTVTEVYLEDVRGFCPLLRTDLRLSAFLDSAAKKSGAGAMGGSKPALDDRLMAVCVKTLSTVMKRGEAALVFVAGFADIEDLHALFTELPAHCAVEAFPFHSLISPEEQDKVFEPAPDKRKVILATNIAEASLTIRNVKYVVDFGVAKALRYDAREHRAVLGYTWVSKASANQRRGRTGRVCDGTCIRLYTREFFAALPMHEEPQIITQPLDSVLLSLKLMGLPDPRRALLRCITPPDEDQIVSAATHLYELGAVEGPEVDARVTSLAPLLNTLGMDLPIARFMVLGCVLGVATEAVVMAAALCLPQDVFLLPHPTFHEKAADYLHTVARVQYYKESLGHNLGSDPLTALIAYSTYLRAADRRFRHDPDASASASGGPPTPTAADGREREETPGSRRRQRKAGQRSLVDWCKDKGLMGRALERLNQIVKEVAHKLAKHSDGSLPSFQEMRATLTAPGYLTGLTRDEGRLFLLRAIMLGAFYPNLLRGTYGARGLTEEEDRTLVIRRPPEAIRSKPEQVLPGLLGLEEDIACVRLARNRRDVEVVFHPADLQAGRAEEEDYFDPDASGAHGQSQQAAAAAAMGAMSVLLPPLDVGRHGLEDVHFAVKGILNAKTGMYLVVENPAAAAAAAAAAALDNAGNGRAGDRKKKHLGSKQQQQLLQQECPSRLLELNVTGKYQMNWAALRSGTRVNFQKSSLLRNAASTSLPARPLFAVTPEIVKYLSKDQQPFYSATRASLLPFPEPLVAILVAVFSRGETVRFRRFRPEAQALLAELKDEEGVEGLPGMDEYWAVTVGGEGPGRGLGWLTAPCKATTNFVRTINDVRRGISQAVASAETLPSSASASKQERRGPGGRGRGRPTTLLRVSRVAVKALHSLQRTCTLAAAAASAQQPHVLDLLRDLPATEDAYASCVRTTDVTTPVAGAEEEEEGKHHVLPPLRLLPAPEPTTKPAATPPPEEQRPPPTVLPWERDRREKGGKGGKDKGSAKGKAWGGAAAGAGGWDEAPAATAAATAAAASAPVELAPEVAREPPVAPAAAAAAAAAPEPVALPPAVEDAQEEEEAEAAATVEAIAAFLGAQRPDMLATQAELARRFPGRGLGAEAGWAALAAEAAGVPGLVVLPLPLPLPSASSSTTTTATATATAYLLSPPLLALLGAANSSPGGGRDAAAVVGALPAGSRVLLTCLDLVHKEPAKRRALPSVVSGLRRALPPAVLQAALGKGEGEGEEGEVQEQELRAWVVRAARAMPLLRVEGQGDGAGCWLGLAAGSSA